MNYSIRHLNFVSSRYTRFFVILTIGTLTRCNEDHKQIGQSKELQVFDRNPREDASLNCLWNFKMNLHTPTLRCTISSKESNQIEKSYELSVSNNRNFTPAVRKRYYLRIKFATKCRSTKAHLSLCLKPQFLLSLELEE